MTALEQKLTYFKQKQTEILALEAEVMPKRQALQKEGNEKIQAVQEEYTQKMNELNAPLIAAGEKYKAELKAFCGITDGEKTNVLELLSAFAKLGALTQ